MLDPYVYSGTDILINRLDIRNAEDLSQAEIAINIVATFEGFPSGKFNYEHLQNIHKHAFHELYHWAGQTRTVDISKGSSTFCRCDFIEKEINKLLNNLANKDQFLTIYPEKAQFVHKFADYYCEINVIHPFREGNGRVTRVFFEQLAQHNGYTLDLSSISKSQWIEASIDGFNCDNTKLENILSDALQPLKI